MKRTFTPKVESVSSRAADKNALGKLTGGKLPQKEDTYLRLIYPELNRRACTSAVTIGLAISMGACSLLLPKKGDKAIAAEPVAAEPTVTTSAPEEAVVVSPSQKAEVLAAAVSKPASIAAPRVGAAEKSHNSSSEVEKARVAKIPQAFGSVDKKAGDTNEKPVSSEDVASTSLQQSAPATVSPTRGENALTGESEKVLPQAASAGEMRVDKTAIIPGSANDVLKAKQDDALNRSPQRDRLQNSLAELRFEESTTTSGRLKVDRGVVPQFLQPSTVASPSVEAKEPMVTEQSQAVGVPSNPTLSQNTGEAFSPKAAAAFNQEISQPDSAETPNESTPEVIDSQAAIVLSQTISPPGALETPKANEANTATSPNLTSEPIQTADVSATPEQTLPVVAPVAGVNTIASPNQPQINQQLKIGLTQSSTLVASLNPTSGDAAPEKALDAAPSQAKFRLSTSVLPAEANEPLASTKASTATDTLASTLRLTAVPNSTILVARKPSKSALSKSNSQDNPYIDKLRVEIIGLREQYRVQGKAGQTNLVAQTTPTSIPIPVPPPESNLQPLEQYPVDRQRGHAKLEVQPTSTAIEIPVPQPENNTQPARPAPQRSRFATAPAGTDNYNPSIQLPVGQPVDPAVPPLQGPGPYLPQDQLPQFTGYNWPAKGVLSSGYGWRWGRMHKGIDIAGPVGTPIFAAAPGVVLRAGWNAGGYGNLVEIQHADGSITRYGHNSRLFVQAGHIVAQGEQIAAMGNTGRSTGPHLHFEVHSPGKGAVNPIAFLPRRQNS